MRFQILFRKSVFVLMVVCLAGLCFIQSRALDRAAPLTIDVERDPFGVVVLDGSGVHDAGQLLMHTGNWGAFGSYPGAGTAISQYPSAEWPAGSGVEHLYIAGLWVGGFKKSEIPYPMPCVSTGAFEMEFRPTAEPVDRIYETFEGASGGTRLPFQHADDDGDGLIDEDPLDGRDNDGDGLIDEDFAAISQQMFSSWYTDDQLEAISEYPEHEPLNLKIRQESYQWTDPRFDDFVGITFTMTNTGTADLIDMYIGFLLDFDIGWGGDNTYWNDFTGYWEGIRSTELGEASLHIAYMCDTEDGEPSSYIGAMLLGHTVSTDGVEAPASVNVRSLKIFSGEQPYNNGGDPTNDFQRYELLSTRGIDMNPTVPRDYRVLMSSGRFALNMGQSLEYQVGFVCGATFDELLDNAARCQKLYDGLWFDVDGDPATGVDGRETHVNWIIERPDVRADLDIKPGSCPNPFNVNVFEFLMSGNPKKGGVLPVAILGCDGFDVRDIDLGTVRLEQVEPLAKGCEYEDVSSPVYDGAQCECIETGPDGYEDLVLKFSKQQIAAALSQLGLPQSGQETILTMRGNLLDGTPFEAADCIRFVGPPPEIDSGERKLIGTGKNRVYDAVPNPFNPVTTIRFELATPGHVNISIYDVGGHLVRTLIDQTIEVGWHEVMWDGKVNSGASAASGVYFYRFVTQGTVDTRKMLLVR